MNGGVVTVPDAAAETRWLDWEARGAAADRRSARAMRWVFANLITLAVGWLTAQLL
jgi:hypothetical protein